MCGIIGIIAAKPVAKDLYRALKRLEYRGYDSAGLATIADGKIVLRRAKGKLDRLKAMLEKRPLPGNIGIGHTRWATHGLPTANNAHPHATKKVAVVHNGIIENYASLKRTLQKKGYKFVSETDTEVVPNLITWHLDNGADPETAVRKTLGELEGAFALAIIFSGHDNLMIGARKGSPLAVGFAENSAMLGSDATALSLLADKICYLDEGDMAVLTKEKTVIFDKDHEPVKRPIQRIIKADSDTGKGRFPHYMLKEIHDQVSIINTTLSRYFNEESGGISLPKLPFALSDLTKITIIACGTSYYSGMVAKYWIEKIAMLPVEVDIASEFRYRDAVMEKGGMALFISQSGETADTLAALRYARKNRQHIISIVNVPESTIARESDVVLHTSAGLEIGVASTKAFTSQLIVLACFALSLAKERKKIKDGEALQHLHSLSLLSGEIAEILSQAEKIREVAHKLYKAKNALYIGRGVSYPIALEGALKLKEISYIHAEANAAGELKHGPIALIDENMPVVVIAPKDELFDKTASNAQEIAARKGKIILISTAKGIKELKKITHAAIEMPESSLLTSPVLYSIPVQLLAYYMAVFKGCNIDQPRNLAKSVTVE